MDLAELMSDRITKLINASDAPELFIASQKLSVLQEKVENFTLNSKSDSANPKQSTGQSSKEKNAEEYRQHVLVTWTDTFYQAICDPSLGRHPDSAPFYHNSGYRVTMNKGVMNKIFGSMDDTVKWSKAEYEANIQLAASTTDRNNVSLHIDFSFGNMLVIILVLSTYYLLL
ncbi:hypothetical protein DdX_17359 [Ditylenchus destructor]|uniref:Uncharacterized protein n=1 Tax=Ditylenchus destructor TaxID=166010 RepID=A0AAD4MMX3_9BILA|nr:hypothetical protein DdX_17359 [Ditylenchus destructor]